MKRTLNTPLTILCFLTCALSAHAFTPLVTAGNTVNGESIDSTNGSLQTVYGTTQSVSIVTNGARQVVENGGKAYNTIIVDGVSGTQTVNAGGLADGAQINAAGIQIVNVNANAANTIVNNGTQMVTGGSVTGTQVSGTGQQILTSGTASGTILNGKSAVQRVNTASTAINTTINGGTQNIQSGGAASGTEIYSGGVQNVNSGANAAQTNIYNGGVQNIVSASVSDVTIHSGGVQNITSSANMGGTNTVNSGGSIVLSGVINPADPNSSIVMNGGTIVSATSGSRINAKVTGGGNIQIGIDGATAKRFFFNNISGDYTVNPVYSGSFDNLASSYILITDNTSGATANFKTAGNTVTLGIKEYVFSQSGLNYILNATGGYGTNVRAAASVALTANEALYAMAEPMIRRVGELQWQASNSGGPIEHQVGAFWIRGIARQIETEREFNVKQTLYGGEFGFDRKIFDTARSAGFIGVLGQYAQSSPEYRLSGSSESTDSDLITYGGGVYFIWLGPRGWYFDLVGRYHRIEQDVDSTNSSGASLASYKVKQNAFSAGAELGKETLLGRGFYFTPSVRLNYIHAADATAEDETVGEVAIGKTNLYTLSGNLLLGLRLYDGANAKVMPYIRGSYARMFGDDTETVFAGVQQKTEPIEERIELGGGLDIRFSDYVYMYADGAYQFNTDDEWKGWTAALGFRFEF